MNPSIVDDEPQATAKTAPGAFGGSYSQRRRTGASIPVLTKMLAVHALSPAGRGE